MIMQMMSVRDVKSDSFGNPWFAPTVGMAVRSFTDEVNRDENSSTAAKHPEDFQLYHLGSFESTSGTFETQIPKLVITGSEVKEYKKSAHLSAV